MHIYIHVLAYTPIHIFMHIGAYPYMWAHAYTSMHTQVYKDIHVARWWSERALNCASGGLGLSHFVGVTHSCSQVSLALVFGPMAVLIVKFFHSVSPSSCLTTYGIYSTWNEPWR